MVLASVGSGGVMEGEGSDRENVGGNVNINKWHWYLGNKWYGFNINIMLALIMKMQTNVHISQR